MGTVDKRNYGIDLVKIVAMLLVTFVHILRRGGAIDGSLTHTTKGVLCVLEGVAFCCINLFAMSTGFLCYGKKTKLSRLLQLWMQVFFWSVAVSFGVALYSHDMSIIIKKFKTVFFVFTSNTYWYFTAYVALFFLIPVINYLLENIDTKRIFRFTVIFFVLFSIVPFVFNEDKYTAKGYSFVWLVYMYLVGALIKKYDILSKVKQYKAFIGIVLFTILEGTAICIFFNPKNHILKAYKNIPEKYNFFLVVLLSIFIFLFVAKLQIKGKFLKSAVKMLSATSFSVYLIHVHPLIFDKYFAKLFKFIGSYSWSKAIGAVLLFGIILYTCCTILGWIQMKLFELIKINKLCDYLAKKTIMAYNKLYSRFLYKLAENKNIT